MSNSKLKKITSARLFLPIVCLIAVLLINVIKTPDFFNITIRNGVLFMDMLLTLSTVHLNW